MYNTSNKKEKWRKTMREIFSNKKETTLLLIFFLIEFTRGAFLFTFLPLYTVKYLSLSIIIPGLAVSTHYLVETFCKGAAGWHLDRRGHSILFLGLFLSLIALLTMKLMPSSPVLLAGSALFGLGVSPVWLAVISAIAPVQKKDRASRMGLIFTVWLAGGGSGPVIINFFIARNYNLAFWLIIALWGIALFLAATFLFIKPGNIVTTEASFSPFKKELSRLAKNQAVTRVLLPGMFLQTLAGGLLLPILPIHAQNHLGLNPNQYGILLLVGGAAAAIAFLPMGRLADRISNKILLTMGFGMSAFFLGLFITARSPFSAYLLAGLVGFSYAILLPAWNNFLAKAIRPDRQATGWGIFATVEGMGAAIGPALGGLIAKGMGTPATILFSTLLLASMACFYSFYPVERFFAK